MTHTAAINDQASGCTCRKWTGPARLPGESLGVYILRHVIYEGYNLATAPRTRATDEELESNIASMFKSYNAELVYVDDEQMKLTPEMRRSITSWLRIGYRRAIRRYDDRQAKAQQLFTKIEDAADKHLKYAEQGAQLNVRVNFRSLTATITCDEYPEGEWY